MTLWLAFGVVCIPLAGQFQSLRQVSGSMGKTLLFSVLKVILAIAIAPLTYRAFGLAGLAAVFMVVPMIDASYGYFRGARGCGFSPSEISRPIMLAGLSAMALVLAAGLLIMACPATGPVLTLHEKVIHLPGWSEWLAGGFLVAVGLTGVYRQIKQLR